MPNRSQQENMKLLLEALRQAADKGLTLDEAKVILFGDDPSRKSDTKKLLEHLRSKGYVKTKIVQLDIYYSILPGR
jgi:hypothetical protein